MGKQIHQLEAGILVGPMINSCDSKLLGLYGKQQELLMMFDERKS